MQKKALFFMPDDPSFDESTSAGIRTFDHVGRVSFSAALVAYEARSDTGWISMIYEKEQLVPAYVPGPTPRPAETFAQFKDYWLSLYAPQIEAVLSSNPKNLGFHAPRWFLPKAKGRAGQNDNPFPLDRCL